MNIWNKLIVFSTLLLVFNGFLPAFAQGATIINSDINDELNNTLILDADDTGGNVKLQFGGTIDKYMLWDTTNSWFSFNADINLGGNEIKDFRVENLATAPTCGATYSGRMYHNTVDTKTYVCDGTNWTDITAINSTSTKVVTVGSSGADYSSIASAATYLNTLSGGIMLLSAETHQITTQVNLKNIILIGKGESSTTIQMSGSGQIDAFDTTFNSLKFDINSITDSMAIDVSTGSSSLLFEWVNFDIQDSGDSLIDSNAGSPPVVTMKFVKCDESGGNGEILKDKLPGNIHGTSTVFIDVTSSDNPLQMSDWDVSLMAGGRVYTSGTVYSIPANSIVISPDMNLRGAIASLESTGSGGLITLLPGVHNIGKTLTITGDSIQIMGYGDSSIIRASGFPSSTDEIAAIQVGVANGTNPANDVVLRDFKVEVASEIHGIRVAGGDDDQVYNVTVQKTSGASSTGANAKVGIQFLDGSSTDLVRPVIKNCRVFGNGTGNYFTDGIHVSSDNRITGVWGYGNNVLNALVEGNNVDFVGETAYVFVGADSSSLFNNRASRMGVSGAAFGIYMGNITNVTMNNNVFVDSAASGTVAIGIDAIAVTGGSGTYDSVFSSNIINGTASGGVGFVDGFQVGASGNGVYRTLFENNSILGATTSSKHAFTVLGDVDDSTFTSNSITGWDYGVTLSASTQDRNNIQENVFVKVTQPIQDLGTDTKVDVSAHRATSNPAVTNDKDSGFYIGAVWINTSTDESWICVDDTVGSAVWNKIIDDTSNIGGTDANNFVLDQDGTGGDVTLQFGTTLTRLFGWDSSEGVLSTFNNQFAFRNQQSSNPPVACTSAVSGRQWMDSDTGILYICDTSNGRNKWLSTYEAVIFGDESGSCHAGQDPGSNVNCNVDWGNGLGPDSNTDLGFYIPYPVTITGYGFSEDNDACTSGSFDLEVWSTGSDSNDNNYTLESTVASGLTGQAHNSNSLNVDLAGNEYILWGIDNNCGQAIDDWNMIIYYRARHN